MSDTRPSMHAAGRRCPDRPATSYGPWHEMSHGLSNAATFPRPPTAHAASWQAGHAQAGDRSGGALWCHANGLVGWRRSRASARLATTMQSFWNARRGPPPSPTWVRNGRDDEACRFLCAVAGRLHASRPQPLPEPVWVQRHPHTPSAFDVDLPCDRWCHFQIPGASRLTARKPCPVPRDVCAVSGRST